MDMTQTKKPIRARELASQRKREEVLKEPPQELTGDLKADMALIKSLSTTVRILFFGNLPWVPKNGWRPASSMPMPWSTNRS